MRAAAFANEKTDVCSRRQYRAPFGNRREQPSRGVASCVAKSRRVMRMQSIARHIRNNLIRVGLSDTVHDVAMRATNRLLLFRLLRCVVVEKVRPELVREQPAPRHGLSVPESSGRIRKTRHFPAGHRQPRTTAVARSSSSSCALSSTDRRVNRPVAMLPWSAQVHTTTGVPSSRPVSM